jgi:hypothetical protein
MMEMARRKGQNSPDHFFVYMLYDLRVYIFKIFMRSCRY